MRLRPPSNTDQIIASQRNDALCQSRPNAPQHTIVLLDHLVGAGKHRRWHGEAECLSSFEVDRQFVFSRRLHRQVCGLFAP